MKYKYTTEDVSEKLDMSCQAILLYSKKGCGRRIGRRRMWSEEDIEFISKHKGKRGRKRRQENEIDRELFWKREYGGLE